MITKFAERQAFKNQASNWAGQSDWAYYMLRKAHYLSRPRSLHPVDPLIFEDSTFIPLPALIHLNLVGTTRTTMTKKKVLVTGASGYLGGRLCHALVNRGYSVRALVRRTSDISNLPSPTTDGPLQLVYGDVTDCTSLLDASTGCKIIFHAAAVVEPWLPDPSRFFAVSSLNFVLVRRKAKI